MVRNMDFEILIESGVDSIVMPENLKLGLEISEKRKKCQSSGCQGEFYGFAFGQSPFHVPEILTNALIQNVSKGHYSAAEGISELREAIASFNKRYFKLDVEPDRIIVGPGTKSLIDMVFTIIRGDVIIPSPSWIGYFPQVRLLNKHFHTFYLKPECEFKIQPDDLDIYLKRLHKEQHILVLNNPHNPTGVLYNSDELSEIAEVCRRYHVLVLADEIYALTTYKQEDFVSMGTIYPEGTLVTNGLSKDRSSGGYRLGSCILPEKCSIKLIEDFRKVAATVYTNVCTPIQYAAVSAYEETTGMDEYFRTVREVNRIIGLYFSRAFDSVDGIRATVPQGSFYFFADFNAISPQLIKKGVVDSNELGRSLMSHPYHLATVTGDSCMLKPDNFGARIAFVDYNGKAAYDNFKKDPEKALGDEEGFVQQNAARMVRGVDMLKEYVNSL